MIAFYVILAASPVLLLCAVAFLVLIVVQGPGKVNVTLGE